MGTRTTTRRSDPLSVRNQRREEPDGLVEEVVHDAVEAHGGRIRVVPRLLDDVAAAAERMRAAEDKRHAALEDLRAKVRAARDEGIPFAAIGRAAGLSRERVRQLYAGR
jgi:hypothetical protein